MESPFPRCVYCAGTLSIGGGIVGTLKAFLKAQVKCARCGRSMKSSDAQVMGETFGAAVLQLHQILRQQVHSAPVLNPTQAQAALADVNSTGAAHRIHGDEEICCLAVKVFRMALRHEAIGNQGVITVSLLTGPENSQVVKIHAPNLGGESTATTLLVARVGPKDFLATQTGGQSVPPQMVAHPGLRRDRTISRT